MGHNHHTPQPIASTDVIERLRDVDGITDVHDAHLWQIDDSTRAFQAHVVLWGGEWSDAHAIRTHAKRLLRDKFGITHASLEFESSAQACTAIGI